MDKSASGKANGETGRCSGVLSSVSMQRIPYLVKENQGGNGIVTGIRIIGTGKGIPETVVKNEDFTRFVETSDEWITTRTGIRERRISTGETTWQLGAKAARQALDDAGISPKDLDLILVTTVTADTYTPSIACLIGADLGTDSHTICLDINGACTGFIFALDMAHKYLMAGMRRVLIVSAERLSKITNFADRSTCVLFGDGAGACVVEGADKPFASYLRCDGTGAKLLYAISQATENPFAGQPVQMGEPFTYGEGMVFMDGREVYKFAVKAMPEAVEQAAAQLGMKPEDLDWIVPHQANIRIIQTAAKGLEIPMEKFAVNLERYGNTSSASIPLCLDEYRRAGKFRPGDKVCFVGFGAGLTYGAAIVEF